MPQGKKSAIDRRANPSSNQAEPTASQHPSGVLPWATRMSLRLLRQAENDNTKGPILVAEGDKDPPDGDGRTMGPQQPKTAVA